jgi:hypothetical protein
MEMEKRERDENDNERRGIRARKRVTLYVILMDSWGKGEKKG